MDLLPRVTSEFSTAAYWESFFSKRKKSFEWYGNYLELCAILHRYIKAKGELLFLIVMHAAVLVVQWQSG